MSLGFELLSEGDGKSGQAEIIGLLGGLSEELQLNLTETELKTLVNKDWPQDKPDLDHASLKLHIEKHPQILEWLYYELE